MEHSELYFDCSLGESIENLVAWGWKRAKQTVRGYGIPYGFSSVDHLQYRNGALFGSIDHSTSEGLPWLNMTPFTGSIGALNSITTNWFFNPTGLSAGTYRGTANVTHDLYNSPETVWAVFTVATRRPVTPLVVSFTPVDFSIGPPQLALMNLTFNPVTVGTDGNPITVDHYLVYYDNEWPMVDPAAANIGTQTNVNLYFHNVGMLERAFVRVTAVDTDGLLLADSNPELPLPDAATLQQAPANFVQAPILPVVEELK
jgi:hypothetical protein